MRKPLGLGLLGVVGAASLVVASSAFGAYAPKLSITHRGGDEFDSIEFSQTDADDPTAKVTILVPAGFTPGLSRAPGTSVGLFDGSVIVGAPGGLTVPASGTIVAGDQRNAALQEGAKDCTGTKKHPAIWLLNVSAAGQQLPAPVPLYIDRVEKPPFSAFASASIQLCLPPPPLAAFHIKLLEANLEIANKLHIFAPPATAGAYRWTAINTPYKADNTPNAAGTVEAQGTEVSPVDASLTAKRITKTRRVKHKRYTDIFYKYSVRLTGSVRAGGLPDAGGGAKWELDPLFGEDIVAEGTTSNTGTFTKTLRLTRTTAYFAKFSKDAAVVAGGTCVPLLQLAPGVDMPCPNVTDGGFSAATKSVDVVMPKLTHRRVKNKP